MRISYRDLEEGGIIPRFYGISYLERDNFHYVCHIFPLNHIVGWARGLWNKVWMKVRNQRISIRDRRLYQRVKIKERDAYMSGYWAGKQDENRRDINYVKNSIEILEALGVKVMRWTTRERYGWNLRSDAGVRNNGKISGIKGKGSAETTGPQVGDKGGQ